MAIKIPSSKIYDRQNPKVIDNIIERFEIVTNKISYSLNDGSSVYSNNIETNENSEISGWGGHISDYNYRDFNTSQYFYARLQNVVFLKTIYTKIERLEIPILSDNKYIKSITTKYDTEQKSSTISISYSFDSITYKATADWNDNEDDAEKAFTNISYGAQIDRTTTNEAPFFVKTEETEFYKYGGSLGGGKLSSSATIDIKQKDISSFNADLYYTIENDCFVFTNIFLPTKVVIYHLVGFKDTYFEQQYPIKAAPESKIVEYLPVSVSLTFQGKTFGIQLEEIVENIYLDNQKQNSKKVLNIENNELLQTTNYIIGEKENSIKLKYSKTLQEYLKGKETATIRCSIANYYEYQSVEGVISIDKKCKLSTDIATTRAVLSAGIYFVRVTLQHAFKNDVNGKITWLNDVGYKIEHEFTILAGSTEIYLRAGLYRPTNVNIERLLIENLPMCFAIGDEVIPMVYGADGKDRPMSLYQDGTPKVFQVLGINIYYDGAVWQELSLQEVAQSK